ncbi:MAG: hypothetical protein IPN73_09300 [Saprospiraceae bacterium]|nr:hypothetical protein [Saprospiraceae bacterium]MBK8850343.1 hypothetical protein [Saprospiraceae bacterium]
MDKRASFFVRVTWIFMVLTAVIHSLSFFAEPTAANETESQLLHLMQSYKADMGAGFHRSMDELFTSISACLSLLCLLGGLVTLYLSKAPIEIKIFRGIMLIHTLIFGIAFVVMLFFAFLPPIVCMGLIFITSGAAAYFLK